MKRSPYLLMLVPLALVGCAGEPTTVRRHYDHQEEVTTNGASREVLVTRTPHRFALETQTRGTRDRDMHGRPAIGDGPEPTTSGCRAVG
jgi:hypothetical protein